MEKGALVSLPSSAIARHLHWQGQPRLSAAGNAQHPGQRAAQGGPPVADGGLRALLGPPWNAAPCQHQAALSRIPWTSLLVAPFQSNSWANFLRLVTNAGSSVSCSRGCEHVERQAHGPLRQTWGFVSFRSQ